MLFNNPAAFSLIFGGLVISIGIHEAAHAYTADYLGDPTPRSQGRTTLNPLAHLDPLGTAMILLTGFFGWGKPSPYDPFNLRDPRRDTALIALSGPAVNLIIASLLALVFRTADLPQTVSAVVFLLIRLNITLAIFNLLPIPPLDGSKIASLFMSHESGLRFQHQNNLLLLFLFILPVFGGLSLAAIIVSPIASILLKILLG